MLEELIDLVLEFGKGNKKEFCFDTKKKKVFDKVSP